MKFNMPVRRAVAGLLLAFMVLTLAAGSLAGQEETNEGEEATPEFPGLPLAQPSYDTLRIANDGETLPYNVWVDWVPELVTTPDGGAWAFFGAQIRPDDGPASRRLFASRFDPERRVWLPATAMPGERVQFGPAAVIDGQGRVHLLYSELTPEEAGPGSTLLYARFDANGTMSDPVPVAPDPAAGYQMMPALAVDAADRVHALWRDQRGVPADARKALPANADLYGAALVDGAWGSAEAMTVREAADVNAAWPLLAVDGDRLVAVWSLYRGTTEEASRTALRVEWSTRPTDASAGWSSSQTLIERAEDEIGGRLIDLAGSNSDQGVAIVYGRFARSTNQLALKRLPAGGEAWSEDVALSAGDYGYLPTIATAPEGRAFVVYNTRRNRNVEIGAVSVLRDGSVTPPVTLSASEDGVQARAAVAVDARGRPWVVYMHQPAGSSVATEIRTLRGAELGAATASGSVAEPPTTPATPVSAGN